MADRLMLPVPSFANPVGPWPATDGGGPQAPPEAAVNLAADPRFPHDKVRKLWTARVEYAREDSKKIREHEREARIFLEALDAAAPQDESEIEAMVKSRFGGTMWATDLLKLINFVNFRDPQVIAEATTRPDLRELADATSKLEHVIEREKRFLFQKRLATIKLLLANKAYLRTGWDHYRWLPTLEFCAGNVHVDPDYMGDTRKAQWMIEECFGNLEDFMNDPEIPQEYKEQLRTKKDAHVHTRAGQWFDADEQSPIGGKPAAGGGAAPVGGTSGDGFKLWDDQPGFGKVHFYRIWSREGAGPGLNEWRHGDAEEPPVEAPSRDLLRTIPELTTDRKPTVPPLDPADHGNRVMLIVVKDFPKVLKAVPWSLGCFDRDDFPIMECRIVNLPSDNHGFTIFQIIAPHLKAINRIMESWYRGTKAGSRRVVLVDTDSVVSDEDLRKIAQGDELEVIKVQGLSGVHVIDFSEKGHQQYDILPELRRLHDEASGVTDAIRGVEGNIRKTATEVETLTDQSMNALSFLIDAVENLHSEAARRTIQAAQEYIPRDSVFEPCPTCGAGLEGIEDARGTGTIPDSSFQSVLAVAAGSEPPTIPCPTCGGTGWDPEDVARGVPKKPGVDYWIGVEAAQAWPPDTMPVETIRHEIMVRIEPGSALRNWRERQFALISGLFDRLMPLYTTLRLPRPAREVVRSLIRASEIPNPEPYIPTEEEMAQALAPVPPPPQQAPSGPTPEQLDLQRQEMEAEHERASEELRLKVLQTEDAAEVRSGELAIRNREMDLREREIGMREQQGLMQDARERESAAREHEENPEGEREAGFKEREIALKERQAEEESARQAAEDELSKKTLQTFAEGVQQTLAPMAEAAAKMVAVAGQLEQAVAEMRTNSADGAKAAQSVTAGVQALEKSAQAMAAAATAPKKVVRDAAGKIAGVVVAGEGADITAEPQTSGPWSDSSEATS